MHGLDGSVRIEVLTDRPADRFVTGAVLHREGDDRPLTIDQARAVEDGPGWRIRFREIADRASADGLRGVYLDAVVGPADVLERGSYYWHEVVGASVVATDGRDLGRVRDVYRVGEAEIFEVAGGSAGTFDVPAVRAFIRVFAPRRGEIVVDAEALGLSLIGPVAAADGPPAEGQPDGDEPGGQAIIAAPRRKRWSRHGRGRAAESPPTAD